MHKTQQQNNLHNNIVEHNELSTQRNEDKTKQKETKTTERDLTVLPMLVGNRIYGFSQIGLYHDSISKTTPKYNYWQLSLVYCSGNSPAGNLTAALVGLLQAALRSVKMPYLKKEEWINSTIYFLSSRHGFLPIKVFSAITSVDIIVVRIWIKR